MSVNLKNIKPSIKNKNDLYEQSTQASTTNTSKYTVPELNSNIIDDSTNDEHINCNKQCKQETTSFAISPHVLQLLCVCLC